MLLRPIFILSIMLLTGMQLYSQCSCTDCPVNTISNGTVSSTLNISGATNNTLGSGGQELISVYIDYDTDAINEVDMILYAPDGSSVTLIQNTGIEFDQNLNFKFCFVSCDAEAFPEPGFSEVFDSSEDWIDESNYSGSYYPAGSNPVTGTGCLETLTGPVNGDWVLEIEDFVIIYDGVINDWFLVFSDNSGTDCTNEVGCSIPIICEADGGELNGPAITECENDPALDVSINPEYPTDPPPSSADYGYFAVVYNASTGVIIEYVTDPDFSDFPVGEYTFCGLSYILIEESLITPANGVNTITDLTSDITNDVFCGDLSEGCINVNVLEPLDPMLLGPLIVCEGESVQYSLDNIDASTIATYVINTGTFSFFEVTDNVLEVVFESGPVQLCGSAANSCGIFTDCIDITVSPAPEEITIDGPLTVCTDETHIYTFSPPIQAGEFYNVIVTGGNLQALNNNTAVVNWGALNNTIGEICVTKFGTNCPGEEICIDIEILDIEIPDQILLQTTLCEGESAFANVLGNPDILNYLWQGTNLTEISGNGTPTINYEAGSTGTAEICVTIESLCGFSDPICEDITINSSSPADISITSDLCSFEFTLTSSEGGVNTQWTFIDGPSTPIFSNPNDQTTNATVTEPGIYEIGFQDDDNDCAGTSSIMIELFPPLELSFTESDCITDEEYQVTITITGGAAPYSVDDVVITGDVFVSNTIASGESYEFLIEDNAGCGLPLITGVFNCLCETNAGSMSAESIEVCAEQVSIVAGISNLDTTMLNGDIGLYYLHDLPGTTLGTIIDFNNSGIFEYQAGIIPGVTYYISLVVGQAQSGSIDLANSCTSVSAGQPVIFYPKPMVSWEIPDTICGNSFFVRLFDQSFLESISWEFVSGPSDLTIITSGDSSYFTAPISDVYIYDLLLFNSWCDTTITFTFDVPVDPSLININQDCTLDPAFYLLSFEVQDGLAPFTSSIPGSFNGNMFESDALDITLTYQVIITDFNGCETSIEVNPINCSCDISIGTIATDTLLLCTGDLLDPTQISSEDYQFDEDIYSAFYYTYSSTTDAVEDYIEFSDGAPFDQLPEYLSDVVYYVRLIISLPDVDITNGLVLDDPCLTVSEPVPFRWNEDIEFIFDIDVTLCVDEGVYEFEHIFQGPFPYQVGFETSGQLGVEFTIDEATEILSFPIYAGATEWVLETYDGLCDFTFLGNLTITGEESVDFSLMEVDTLCNNSFFGSVLELSVILSDPSLIGTWTLDGTEATGDFIDFDGFPAGLYTLSFTSNGGSDSCPLEVDSIEIAIIDCDCPIVTMMDQNICSSETSMVLSLFTTTTFAGEFQVSNINGLANPPSLSSATTLDLTDVTPGDYEITYILTDSWPADCDISFFALLDISYQFLSGTAKDTIFVCQGDDLKIPLYDLLEGYDDGGVWFYLDLPVGDTIFTQGLSIGLWEYTYVIESSFPCELQTTNVHIEVTPYPDVAVNSEDVLCFGDTNGQIEIEIFNDFFGPFNCFLDGNEIVDKEIVGLGPGFYTVEISTEEGCAVVFDSVNIGEPSVVEVELGEDLLAFYNDELTIEAIINLLQSDISDISWQDLDGILDEEDLILIQEALSDNTIFLTITDENGCVGLDSINIRLLEKEIGLANIFVPNSDNELNTKFGMPYIPEVEEVLEFRIYDRWGNNVFAVETTDPGTDEGYWNGNHNGQPAQQGVYAYYMRYRLISGVEKIIIGDVTLMR